MEHMGFTDQWSHGSVHFQVPSRWKTNPHFTIKTRGSLTHIQNLFVSQGFLRLHVSMWLRVELEFLPKFGRSNLHKSSHAWDARPGHLHLFSWVKWKNQVRWIAIDLKKIIITKECLEQIMFPASRLTHLNLSFLAEITRGGGPLALGK